MKKNILLFLASLIALSSCGLLLGPLSELSLEQRMIRGWKLAYEFTTNYGPILYMSAARLAVAKFQNEVRCFYYINTGAPGDLYYFNTNSVNWVANAATTGLANKFEISYDNSNSSLIYNDGGTYLYYNGTLNNWNTSIYLSGTKPMQVANHDTILGFSINSPYSNLIKVQFNVGNPVSIEMPDVWNGLNTFSLSKCRNKYNNDTVLYCIYTNGSFFPQMEIASLNNFSSFMLASPYLVTNNMNVSPILESDGADKLYMVYDQNVYKYESGSKSFISELTLPYHFVTGPQNHILSTAFIGDVLLISHFNGLVPNNPPTIWSYNTATKSYTEKDFNISLAGTEYIIGMDMYYDIYSYTLYLAFLTFDTNGNNMRGMLFKNQM